VVELELILGRALSSSVTAVAFGTNNRNVFYVGYADGSIMRTESSAGFGTGTVGGPSHWAGAMPEDPDGWGSRPLTDLAVDPTAFQTVYATIGGYGGGKVWRTTNRGITWMNISGDLPQFLRVHTIALDKRAAGDVLFVGTDAGVYMGQLVAGNWRWTRYGNALPNVMVTDVQIQRYPNNSRILAAATYGRGAWLIPLAAAGGVPVVLGGGVWIDQLPNGTRDSGEVRLADAQVTLLDEFGTVVAIALTDATGAYRFDVELSGTYTLAFTLPTGYEFTAMDQGSDDLDSDVDPLTGQTNPFVVTLGEIGPTFDAGLVPTIP
jgi:hypothetical protein